MSLTEALTRSIDEAVAKLREECARLQIDNDVLTVERDGLKADRDAWREKYDELYEATLTKWRKERGSTGLAGYP